MRRLRARANVVRALGWPPGNSPRGYYGPCARSSLDLAGRRRQTPPDQGREERLPESRKRGSGVGGRLQGLSSQTPRWSAERRARFAKRASRFGVKRKQRLLALHPPQLMRGSEEASGRKDARREHEYGCLKIEPSDEDDCGHDGIEGRCAFRMLGANDARSQRFARLSV